jgi:hypothetical protein
VRPREPARGQPARRDDAPPARTAHRTVLLHVTAPPPALQRRASGLLVPTAAVAGAIGLVLGATLWSGWDLLSRPDPPAVLAEPFTMGPVVPADGAGPQHGPSPAGPAPDLDPRSTPDRSRPRQEAPSGHAARAGFTVVAAPDARVRKPDAVAVEAAPLPPGGSPARRAPAGRPPASGDPAVPPPVTRSVAVDVRPAAPERTVAPSTSRRTDPSRPVDQSRPARRSAPATTTPPAARTADGRAAPGAAQAGSASAGPADASRSDDRHGSHRRGFDGSDRARGDAGRHAHGHRPGSDRAGSDRADGDRAAGQHADDRRAPGRSPGRHRPDAGREVSIHRSPPAAAHCPAVTRDPARGHHPRHHGGAADARSASREDPAVAPDAPAASGAARPGASSAQPAQHRHEHRVGAVSVRPQLTEVATGQAGYRGKQGRDR